MISPNCKPRVLITDIPAVNYFFEEMRKFITSYTNQVTICYSDLEAPFFWAENENKYSFHVRYLGDKPTMFNILIFCTGDMTINKKIISDYCGIFENHLKELSNN